MWKKLWFLSQGPVLGASCSRKMLTTDASLTGWGATLEGRSSQGLWKDHHLSWHINHLEMFAVFLALKNFLADLRGHHLLIRSDNTSPGGFTVTSTLQTGVPNSPVVPREVAVSSSSLHPGGPQCRSRHPVETCGSTPWWRSWYGGTSARHKWICLRLKRRLTVHSGFPSRIQLLSDWTQWYRHGRGFVCNAFPPIALLPGVLERDRWDWVLLLLIAPRWPGRIWFPDIKSLLDGPSLELHVRRDLLSQAGDSIFHPQPELWKLWDWPLRGPSS